MGNGGSQGIVLCFLGTKETNSCLKSINLLLFLFLFFTNAKEYHFS
jgi:hypothetical protein